MFAGLICSLIFAYFLDKDPINCEQFQLHRQKVVQTGVFASGIVNLVEKGESFFKWPCHLLQSPCPAWQTINCFIHCLRYCWE